MPISSGISKTDVVPISILRSSICCLPIWMSFLPSVPPFGQHVWIKLRPPEADTAEFFCLRNRSQQGVHLTYQRLQAEWFLQKGHTFLFQKFMDGSIAHARVARHENDFHLGKF